MRRVGVKVERVKIVKRYERQQQNDDDALFRSEIRLRNTPGDPQPSRRRYDRKQIIRPLLSRHEAEPGPHQPRSERRVRRRTEAHLVRPGEHLTHIEMDILAGLGDGGIERPDCHVSNEQDCHRALGTRRIDERIEQPFEWVAHASNSFSCAHAYRVPSAEQDGSNRSGLFARAAWRLTGMRPSYVYGRRPLEAGDA